jgi:hypothetical protein
MSKKCRYTDCPKPHKLAVGNEQVTCMNCREWMGLLPLKAINLQKQATGDYRDIINYLGQIGDGQPGRTFHSILSMVLDQVYTNTGKWYDPDLVEIHNDEYLDAIQDILEGHE